MEHDRAGQRLARPADTCDVIEMGVGQQDVTDAQVVRVDDLEQLFDLVARIDEDASWVISSARTKPFFMNGGAARLSISMAS
jgi:hypothetical protein